MNDSYIDALNYAIKEEIADHYFHDRRVIEEEVAELEEAREQAASLAVRVQGLLADLSALLIEPVFWEAFWTRAGMEPPDQEGLPGANPGVWKGIKAGFGWKGRYKGRVRRLTERLFAHLEEYLEAHRFLVALVEEVNQDILRFNQNHDFLMLRSVLCEMDPELVAKKFWLGSNLQGDVCFDLEEAMAFKQQPGAAPSLWPLLALPDKKTQAKALSKALSLILKKAPRKVRASLAGPG